MLANLRRKVGLRSGVNTPMPPPPFAENMIISPTFQVQDPAMPAPFTMEELGFVWPNDRGIFSPSAIPVWLQEQVCLFQYVYSGEAVSEIKNPYRAWLISVFLSMGLTASSCKWRAKMAGQATSPLCLKPGNHIPTPDFPQSLYFLYLLLFLFRPVIFCFVDVLLSFEVIKSGR